MALGAPTATSCQAANQERNCSIGSAARSAADRPAWLYSSRRSVSSCVSTPRSYRSGTSVGEAVLLQPGLGDVGGVVLVDVVALVELDQLVGVELLGDAVEHVGQVALVGVDQRLGQRREHVVGRQHLLVVLEQDPAGLGIGQATVGRGDDADVD